MRKESKAWFTLLGQMFKDYPDIVANAFCKGLIKGGKPYIAIYFTSMLIDAAYNGAPVERLVFYAVLGASVTMALSFIGGFAEKKFNQNLEYMYERQAGPLAEKSMQMDYECLEDAKVHNLRESVTGFIPRFGLLGMILDCLFHATDVLASITCAGILIVPKLLAGAGAGKGFTGSPWFSLAFFAVILALAALLLHILNAANKKQEALYEERTALRTRKNFFLDLFAKAESQKDIRMCAQKESVQRELERINTKAGDVMKRSVKLVFRTEIQACAVTNLSTVLVFLFSALYGYLGVISIGSIVSFSASVKRVADNLIMLGEVAGDFKYEGTFAIKYLEFMKLNRRKYEGTIPVEKRRDNKFTVEFENVSFKYPGSGDYVLENLNLKFTVGRKLAIVGKNGSGKTTFIKLLCRLYDVTEGCIKVNGIDIRKYDYREYCDLFGVVFQDFSIFDFKLGESIAGNIRVDRARALDALEKVGLMERFEKLPDGLDTYIGKGFDETGVNFSGGEKQKLAIARAIYKNAPFVIMDEPTAALDPEAEAAVFDGFDKMVGEKTAIYISHRLASCKFCEDILVFDKGKVVQQGTHEELERQEGLYRRLWNAQAGYYV